MSVACCTISTSLLLCLCHVTGSKYSVELLYPVMQLSDISLKTMGQIEFLVALTLEHLDQKTRVLFEIIIVHLIFINPFLTAD